MQDGAHGSSIVPGDLTIEGVRLDHAFFVLAELIEQGTEDTPVLGSQIRHSEPPLALGCGPTAGSSGGRTQPAGVSRFPTATVEPHLASIPASSEMPGALLFFAIGFKAGCEVALAVAGATRAQFVSVYERH